MAVEKSAAAEILEIIKAKGTTTEEHALALYDQLEPVDIEYMFGEWSGAPFETGHPTSKWCADVNFAGKKFISFNEVEPMYVFDEQGNRKFWSDFGTARLRDVKHRGKVSASLIYDNRPTMDYFRKVDDETILSAADNKAKTGTFFFYLRRGLSPH